MKKLFPLTLLILSCIGYAQQSEDVYNKPTQPLNTFLSLHISL